ncbi:MAG: putative Ig domain-containing protein [Desulfuromonadaceae bacterium]
MSAGVYTAAIPLTGTGATNITGTVTDLTTGQALSGATVTLSGGSTTTTATDGSFSFTPAYGTYSLSLSKTGYSGYTVNNVTTSATTGATLKLGMAPPGLLNVTTPAPLVPTSTFVDTIKITGGVGPYTFNLAYGSLPLGLTLDPQLGTITGIPAVSGSYIFAVGVTDSATVPAYAEREYTVNFPVITAPAGYLPRASQNVAYTTTIVAQGGVAPITFSTTPLPAGLTLNSTSGVISGTPTAVGPYSFDVTATDSAGRSYRKTFRMYVEGPLAFATATLARAPVKSPYSQTIVGSGGFPPYLWTFDSGRLPAGLTFNPATAIISGTPTTVETTTFTLSIKDYLNRTVSREFSLEVYNPLVLAATALPRATTGTAYSTSFSASGGATPYSFALTSGALPAGLSLNSVTGTISGTPATTGTYTFTIAVTDTLTRTDSKVFTIYVDSPLSITSTLSNGVVGTVYNQTLSTSGGFAPVTWTVTSGALPAGLTLNSSSGVISGTPTTAAVSTFVITATDAVARTNSKSFTVTIYAVLNITTASAAHGVVGYAYNQSLAAAGGLTPFTWSVSVGSLPAGLALNASSGLISGTPTTVSRPQFTIRVQDAFGQVATKQFTVDIAATPLVLSPTVMPRGMLGVAYSIMLNASGGSASYTFSKPAGTLPTGLSLNATTGIISGTPTATGTFTFTAMVSDPYSRSDSKSFTIFIDPVFTITTTSLNTVVVGSPYNQSVAVIGGLAPYTWSITSGVLPSGLTINSATGVISGTPTTASGQPVVVEVQDAAGRKINRQYTLTVIDPLVLLTTSMPNGALNEPYSDNLLVSGGVPPYTFTLTGQLPAGLSLNGSSGLISGIPTVAGLTNAGITIVDSSLPTHQTKSTSFSIRIWSMATIVTTAKLPSARINTAITPVALTAKAGSSPYSWSLLSGTMPPGVTISSGGLISGTPTVSGNYTFTIRATDSSVTPVNADKQFYLYVGDTIQISTATIPFGSVGVPYNYTLYSAYGVAPYTWSIISGTLPAGLSFSASGVISGTPTVIGSSEVTFRVADSDNPAQATTKTLTISIDPLLIGSTTLPVAIQNTLYSGIVSGSGGVAPLTWSVIAGSLPPEITLNPSTGTLTGTPSACGSFSLTFQLVDSASVPHLVQKGLSLNVACLNSGVCGSSNGGTFTVIPSANLCSVGTASSVNGSGPWNWTCAGISGGTDASCTANIQSNTVTFGSGGNGSITGTTNQTLNYGASTTAVTAVPADGYYFVNWSGTGGFVTTTANPLIVGNVTTAMSITAHFASNTTVVTGACGTDNGGIFTVAPTTNLCTTGYATVVTGIGPWSWTCAGTNGGTTANCSTAVAMGALIPQTGQTACYDAAGSTITCAGTGQDGELKMGVFWSNPRFVDNGDQTQTDKLTGLIWSKNGNPAGAGKTWQQALDYIKTLNSSNYLGYNDWQLPNSNQLESLVNKGLTSSAAWLNGQGFSNVQGYYYWSGSTNANNTANAWIVLMSGGIVGDLSKTTGLYVWPIRLGQSGVSGTLTLPKTGQTTCYDQSGAIVTCSGTGQDGELARGAVWPNSRFGTNGDETVTDSLTGLIWSKNGNPAVATKTWQQAQDYIKTLNSSNYLGHNDWRFPNVNELGSLINKGQANSANWLNGQGFSNVQSNYYWSSNTYTTTTSDAWIMSMNLGYNYWVNKTGSNYVWPVRGGLILTALKSGTGNGTITSSADNINCGATCSASITSGTTVTLTATPNSSSTFEGWSGACGGTGTCNVTINTAQNVTATFTLAPVINGACGASANSTLTIAPTTDLCTTGTATVVTGTGPWSWSCQGSYGGTDASCDANLQTYSLALSFAGTGGGSVSGDMSCLKGSSCEPLTIPINTAIHLIPLADIVSTFSGWSGSCSNISGDCSFTMTGPKSVVATFILAPKAMIGTTGYLSIYAAYLAAISDATIMTIDSTMPDLGLNINAALANGKTVTIKGGYKADYKSRTGLQTYLKGPLKISSGTVRVDGLAIR